MFTVGLYTLGCKVSQYETEAVGEEFARLGFLVCSFDEINDVYVINTCTVTAESDAKCRKYIRRAIKKNPSAKIMVMGCYSQRDPDALLSIEGVSAVVGTQDKMTIPKIALDLLSGRLTATVSNVTSLTNATFEPMTVKGAPRTRAYVKIEDGCDCKCTYCAISAARGPVRSKKREDVISEVEGLYRSGTREVVLTGIETASYGKDFQDGYGLAELIRELDERGSCERIRLGSLAPELIDPKFTEKVKNTKILAPHFHLSMQSGSDKILFAMKRRYNREMALRNIETIRSAFPTAQFTTDLMVGFPGESEEDFLLTLDFLRRARFLSAHVFAYSRRKGTPADLYPDQVPEEIKRERSRRLIEESERVRDEILDEVLKAEKNLSVVAEERKGNIYLSHSDEFIEVSFTSERPDLQGKMIKVHPVSHKNGIMHCEILEITE